MKSLACSANEWIAGRRVPNLWARAVPQWTRLAIALLTFDSAIAVGGTTYYVAKGGSDSNAGTEAAPWLTIQKAVDAMSPGDTAVVGNGVYEEKVTSRVHGGSAAPITLRAQSSDVVVGAFYITHGCHVIDGFTVTGQSATQYQGSVTVRVGGTNCVVRNCTFRSSPPDVFQLQTYPVKTTGYWGTTNLTVTNSRFVNGNYHALVLFGTGHVISGNLFSSTNGWDAIRMHACNVLVSGNTFSNWSNMAANGNHTDLIQAFADNGETATNVVVSGNTAFDCYGAQIANITDDGLRELVSDWQWRNNIFVRVKCALNVNAPRLVFYNNVFYQCTTNFGHVFAINNSATAGRAHGVRLLNNMFVECGDDPAVAGFGWYYMAAGLTNSIADYNCVVGVGTGTVKTGFVSSGNEVHGVNGFNPLFVDARVNKADGFQLLPDSVCIGAGTNLSSIFVDDFRGVSRGSTWDIGAVQFVGSDAPNRPSAPNRLKGVVDVQEGR